MLESIFQAIDEQVRIEMDKMAAEHNAAMADLEQKHRQQIEAKQAQVRQGLADHRAMLLQEQQRQATEAASFRVQSYQREVLERVYHGAIERLGSLEPAVYRGFIKKLYQQLPAGLAGEIRASSRAATVLKELVGAGQKIRADLAEEGLILVTPTVEIDLRFRQLIDQRREITDPLILSLLFN